MRRFFYFVLFLAALAALCSCGERVGRGDILFYQKGGFEAAVKVLNGNGFEFEALLTAEKPTAGSAERDIRLVITAPATLEGITVTRVPGESSVSLGEISLPDGGNICSFVSLFGIEGTPVSFEVKGEDTLAVISGVEGEIYTLLLDKDGFPKRISEEGGAAVYIERFTQK